MRPATVLRVKWQAYRNQVSMTAPLETSRLVLRRWHISDIQPFAEMNSDPQVMEFFPRTATFEQTATMVHTIETAFAEDDFGLWAVTLKDTGKFIGMVGLCKPKFEAHFTPCVEVGWRLDKHYWGKGFASEAAEEALRDGFERIGLTEIVSMTSMLNERSMRVMERIKMTRNPEDDFEHPLVQDGHPLKPHVLYRLTKADWEAQKRSGAGDSTKNP